MTHFSMEARGHTDLRKMFSALVAAAVHWLPAGKKAFITRS